MARKPLLGFSWCMNLAQESKVTYRLEAAPQTTGSSEPVAKHIHGNDAFSVENVLNDVEAALAARKQTQR
jgi:hypothetical protein